MFKKNHMKYKKGDRVRIIANTCGHGFEIGEEVKIRRCKPKDNYYFARSISPDKIEWCVEDQDIELIAHKNCCKPHINPAEQRLIDELDKYASHPSGIIINSHTFRDLPVGTMLEYRHDKVREGVYRHGYYFNNIPVFVSNDHIVDDEIIVL
jgi:hypothetical protein